MENVPKSTTPKGTKQWLRALTASKGNEQLKIQNNSTQTDYHRVIASMKKLYCQAGMEVTVFERDYRFDASEGLFSIHSFLTPHFYWSLDCLTTNNYVVEYDFRGFLFESELKRMLQSYPLDRTAIHKPRQPSFTAFYKRVMQVQESKYQYILNAY